MKLLFASVSVVMIAACSAAPSNSVVPSNAPIVSRPQLVPAKAKYGAVVPHPRHLVIESGDDYGTVRVTQKGNHAQIGYFDNCLNVTLQYDGQDNIGGSLYTVSLIPVTGGPPPSCTIEFEGRGGKSAKFSVSQG